MQGSGADFKGMERAAGIEPASLAWKAKVLPLHNARVVLDDTFTRDAAQEPAPCLGEPRCKAQKIFPGFRRYSSGSKPEIRQSGSRQRNAR